MEPFLVREPLLSELMQFIRALAACCLSGSDETKKALSEALFAECMECQISVNGAELLTAGVMDPTVDPNSKLARIRLGYCARKACHSNRYRLKFYKHVDLNWDVLLPQLDAKMRDETEEADQTSGVIEEGRRAELIRYLRRIVFAFGLLLFIFILRQYYVGGRIPFLREPTKWKVERRIDPQTNKVPNEQHFPY